MHGYAYGDPEYDPSTKYDPAAYGRGASEYSRGAPEPTSARPAPDYRSTTDVPRPQTYDSYERGRPSPNGMEHNPVSTFITVLLLYKVIPVTNRIIVNQNIYIRFYISNFIK